MNPQDLTGKRGEFIASERLLDFCGKPIPYFDPHPLGEKFPTYDLLVELTGGRGSKPYFLAQVKTTRSGGRAGMSHLKVRLEAADVRAMLACPIPTYLIGVDERAEVAYIVSIHEDPGRNLVDPDDVSPRLCELEDFTRRSSGLLENTRRHFEDQGVCVSPVRRWP